MPLYEYQCDACGVVFERIQKFSDPPVEACPTCGGAVRKLVSAPGFQFKGSGWYVTDYARKSGGTSSSGSGSAENTGKSEGKSEKSGDKAESSKADTPAAPATPSGSKDSSGD
jgi:putative FmdB family regulatory protein